MPSLSIALWRGIYLLITCSLWCFSASSKETHVEALFSMWKLVRWKSLESSVALCVCAQLFSHVQLFAIPWTVNPPGSSVHFPSKNTELGYHSFLQGIFPTQGSNPCLLHWWWILYHRHLGSSLSGSVAGNCSCVVFPEISPNPPTLKCFHLYLVFLTAWTAWGCSIAFGYGVGES